jgi:hypothetical protein
MPTSQQQALIDVLWAPTISSRTNVFAILDGARDERIYGAVHGCRLQKCCLYGGHLPWQLEMTAPYLVQLERDDPFNQNLFDRGWGNSWGVFLRTETGIEQLRRHLRGFLRVSDEAGKRLIFRYYDPRVLRVYLPTCLSAEIEQVFGPVSAYLMEGEHPGEVIEFRRDGRGLISERVSLTGRPTPPV